MTVVSLFWYTNMAAVTSCENDLLLGFIILQLIRFLSSLFINVINLPLIHLPAKFQAVQRNEEVFASPCLFHLLTYLDPAEEAYGEYPLACIVRQGVCRSSATRHVICS